jgi:hypothetical protein
MSGLVLPGKTDCGYDPYLIPREARCRSYPDVAQPQTPNRSLTGKVKPQMRLRGLAALLSSFNEQQDRIRCVSWNDRSHVAPSDDAGRRLAGSRQA